MLNNLQQSIENSLEHNKNSSSVQSYKNKNYLNTYIINTCKKLSKRSGRRRNKKKMRVLCSYNDGRMATGSEEACGENIPSDRNTTTTNSSSSRTSNSPRLDDIDIATEQWRKVIDYNNTIVLKMPMGEFYRKPISKCETLCLSFSGAGFLGTYEFGAAQMIVDHGQRLLDKCVRFGGCSCGSLVSTVLIFAPHRLQEAVEEIYRVNEEVHSAPLGIWTPGFYISHRLRSAIDKFIPEDISKANNRLFVSVTQFKTWTNDIISSFSSREELIDVLMASCYHPMYSTGIAGKAPVIRGDSYIDGGYSNNLPEFIDIRTVTCTPFSGDADICPVDKSILFNGVTVPFLNQNMTMNVTNVKRIVSSLVPPSLNVLKKYYDAGNRAAEELLRANNLYDD